MSGTLSSKSIKISLFYSSKNPNPEMPLQLSLHLPQIPSLSSTQSFSLTFPSNLHVSTFLKPKNTQKVQTPIRCSISQIHSYGTMDYERRPMVKWNAIYKRISLMEKPELGAGSVLNQWEKEGRKLSKWVLCRVVKELRKYKRYQKALEVYDWMNSKGERFRLTTSDAAIQLDLIAKVRGVSSAESFFLSLPDTLKDRRIYGALLNAYVQDKLREKAESLIEKMKDKGYITHALPFNVMMTLYMNLKEYDKVDLMVSEMAERNIKLDIYSYNIWLSSRGSESAERMEQAFEQMKLDRTINPNWTTFSTLATMYIMMGQLEKAEDCLKKIESRITGRDRIPYHYLLSLYGNVGNKEEVYRVWNTYKSIFPSIPNLGYHAIISSLIRLGDIEGAENLYDEWLSVKTLYDPRIANLLIGWYVKEGILEKAESFFDHMIDVGGKPNSTTWEILADGHIGENNIPEALSCLKEAFSAEGSKNWRPKPVTVSAFLKLCKQEPDMESMEVLVGRLRQSGYLEDEVYASRIGLGNSAVTGNKLSMIKDGTGDDGNEEDETESLLNQLQPSL